MSTNRERIAALLASVGVLKGTPTGSQVHVPAILGEKDDDKKRRRARAMAKALGVSGMFYDQANWKAEHDALRVAKGGADPGMYVGRMVLNADQLLSWWSYTRQPGEPDLDPSPHVTCMYSTTTFDWTQDRTTLVVSAQAAPDTFMVLGPKNAVVINLDSPIIESRWAAAVAAGAKPTHDSCKVHCTLFYLGADDASKDKSWVEKAAKEFRGDNGKASNQCPMLPPLVLGPEIIGPRGIDVYPAVDAPQWYRDSRGVTV